MRLFLLRLAMSLCVVNIARNNSVPMAFNSDRTDELGETRQYNAAIFFRH